MMRRETARAEVNITRDRDRLGDNEAGSESHHTGHWSVPSLPLTPHTYKLTSNKKLSDNIALHNIEILMTYNHRCQLEIFIDWTVM